jgi:CheY-like chemotaxis protein
VRSQPGSGSLFWFELDAAPAAEARAAAAAVVSATPGYAGPRRRVLVADDVPVNRKMLCELLRRLGFEAHEAADGRQALDQVRLIAPDLVLMDVRMPGLDGLEATAELRKQPATARLPVIMVSANAAPEDQARSLAAGADAFLAKPVDRTRLLTLLTEHLNLQWSSPLS